MRATADVVVIGGGVMGCSILFNLARMGITNTVLLEKDILNGGSTAEASPFAGCITPTRSRPQWHGRA